MTDTHDVDYLGVDDLFELAEVILGRAHVRDAGLLASAAARPQTAVFGVTAYPTLPDKAAALLHSIARNHALADGNKRLAWSAMRAFLLLNGHDVTHEVDDSEAFVLAVAAGELDVPDIAAWIAARVV
jgi:death-on-curing protein